MFGFLRKRLLREQTKLIYQNGSAIEGCLAGAFFDQPEVLKLLSYLGARNHMIATSVPPGERVSSAHMDALLEINMQLRRLYDTTASRFVESFDEATKPLMGWKWVYERELGA